MTVTEFNRDVIFDAAARHWPEREFGWQWRLGDLLAAVRAEITEEVMFDRSEEGGGLDGVINDLRSAIDEIDSAASSLRRSAREIKAAK